jgi:hypothetical protein
MDSIITTSSMQYVAVQEDSDPQGDLSAVDLDSTPDPLSLSKIILQAYPLLSDHPPILPKLLTPTRFEPKPHARSSFLQGSCIPYNMPVYPGALRKVVSLDRDLVVRKL